MLRFRGDSIRIFVVISLVLSLTLLVVNVKVHAEPLWLEGWNKRVELSIDNADIDESLTNFPVLIYLSNSSGRYNEDTTFIFDELQDNVNRKKIAVTTNDGVTECYVEIEEWNQTNEQAWLWVKVPNIDSVNDTALYLYYDVNQTDNTNYIGDTDSIPAENVWDSNYVLIQHLHETSGIHYDSTSNGNDGTPQNNPNQDVTGKIGGADDFDGSDDDVNFGNGASLNIRDEVTLEAWINMSQNPGSDDWYDVIGKPTYSLYLYSENGLEVFLSAYFKINGQNADVWDLGATDINPNEWTRVVVTFDGTDIKGYFNDQLDGTKKKAGTIDDSSSDDLYIAYYSGEENYRFDGKIDEVRISNTARSLAWIGASYESERDDLLDFGSEETEPRQIVGGEILHPNTIPLITPYVFILVIVFTTSLFYKKRS